MGQNLSTTMIKQDVCGARMRFFHELARLTLKVKKSLSACFLTRQNDRRSNIFVCLAANDWIFALEVEATLSIVKDLIKISQKN